MSTIVAEKTKAEIQIENAIPEAQPVLEQLITSSVVNRALSCSLPYSVIREAIEHSRPPRRPNRNAPYTLADEFAEWNSASDEDFKEFERRLAE